MMSFLIEPTFSLKNTAEFYVNLILFIIIWISLYS